MNFLTAARSRLRRIRWWRVYLLLLGLSFTWQTAAMFLGRDDDLPSHVAVVELPAMTAVGPAASGDTVRIAYHQWGDPDAKQTLLLLHGSPGDASNFEKFAPHLQGYRVIAPTLPGFGHSSKWVGDYGIRAYARYVIAMMDKLGIDRAHVLGFSLGSGVALNMVDLAPQRLASLTLYGGIGIQEGEGTGDYQFEHFKYRVGFGLGVVMPEFVPHFGLAGSRAFRFAAIRNFMDTDQRPLRGVLESMNTGRAIPLLILHGRDDPLVPIWTARQHHNIVRHSELVVFDASHFMLFDDEQSKQLATQWQSFLDRVSQPGFTPTRRTSDPFADEALEPIAGAKLLHLDRTMNPWLAMLSIAGGTFVSEDLTCITVGMLANRGELDVFLGVIACFLGIFLGDLGLWFCGYFVGRPVLNWRPVERWMPTHRINDLATWFDRYGFFAVFASRFMPGTRLPLYVSAGVLGRRAWKFVIWALISDLIYTPLVVLIVAVAGAAVAEPMERWLGSTVWAGVLAGMALFFIVKIIFMLATKRGRRWLLISLAKLHRWEFWSPWLFYAPMMPGAIYAHLRYRGFTTFMLSNPAIPMGGLVGESKWDILRQLPARWIVPSYLVPTATGEQRLADAKAHIAEQGWGYPLIIKPNVGQRGVGLKKIEDDIALADYINAYHAPLLLQTYHPGPFEAGVFYVRHPDEQAGRIFSITDKTFPQITGDGQHTLEELLYQHPRYRMQATLFLSRLEDQAKRVIAAGEVVRLAVAGNHCQGTMFTDGSHLITDALAQRIDEIAKHFEGFFFGRFDLRYSDRERFMAGEDLAIVELNGATSESTNIYDPRRSLLQAYITLHKQWLWALRIGDANRKRLNIEAPGLWEMFKALRTYYREREVNEVAD